MISAEFERIIIGGWLQGKHISDTERLDAGDFPVYGNVVKAIKKNGSADIVGICKETRMRPVELAEMILEYQPTFYESAVCSAYEAKAREYIKKSENRPLKEIAERLKIYLENGFYEPPKPEAELVTRYWDEIDKRKQQQIVFTNIAGLDRLMCGIRTKELTAIGARPSVGKSAFLLQIALQIAKQKKKVLYFPLEMSTMQTVERIVAKNLDIPPGKLRRGELNREDWKALSYESDKLAELEKSGNFLIFEGINDIRVITDLIKLHKPYAVAIDQLEQLWSRDRFKDKRERFSYMTNSLKKIAMSEDCAVMIACQVNRAAGNSEPTLANLKESGSIEEDSDNVILLHRIAQEDMTTAGWNDNDRPMIIDVAKQRQGETGRIYAKFVANRYTFYEVTKNG